tara:strand:+ start:251 stop:598 length:348 start_codon:yes stop_codon:yes gene_type:complete
MDDIEGIDCGEVIDGLVWGWLLERKPDDWGSMEFTPLAVFTSSEKFTEWMHRAGYEDVEQVLEANWRITAVPLDDGPTGYTRIEGFIPDHIAEEDIEEYVMQDLENMNKFQEDNV